MSGEILRFGESIAAVSWSGSSYRFGIRDRLGSDRYYETRAERDTELQRLRSWWDDRGQQAVPTLKWRYEQARFFAIDPAELSSRPYLTGKKRVVRHDLRSWTEWQLSNGTWTDSPIDFASCEQAENC